jgi:hypothetical protein
MSKTLTPAGGADVVAIRYLNIVVVGEALLRHFDSEQDVPLLFSARKVREPSFWFWTTSVLLPEEQDSLLRPLLAEEPSWYSTSCKKSSKYQ